MEFKTVRFELGLKSCDLRSDRDECLEDIKQTVHRLTVLKHRLGELTHELVDITTETKQLRNRLNDNYKLVKNFDRMIEEYDKAGDILRAVED